MRPEPRRKALTKGTSEMAKNGSKTKAGKASKAAPREILVVGTKMKDVVKSAGCMSSGDLVEAVSERVHALLSAAAERAKQNGRSTVRPYDL
jgi:hypothetical protein